MNVVRSLWASVQGDPVFMRKLNGWATVLWIVMIPISIFFGWLSSVQYVSALSLWALVSGHLSAWQAARVEVRQEEDANVADVMEKLDDAVDQLSATADQQREHEPGGEDGEDDGDPLTFGE